MSETDNLRDVIKNGVYCIVSVLSDICTDRLELAKKLGATHQVCVKDKKLEELMQEIKTQLEGSPDITIECSGAASSVKMGIRVSIKSFFA